MGGVKVCVQVDVDDLVQVVIDLVDVVLFVDELVVGMRVFT